MTSGLFHATLWHVYHKLDESFENMTLIAILYHHKRTDPQRARLTLYCLLHCLLASALIFAIPAVFCEVHLAVVVSLVLFRFSEIGTKDAAAGLLLKAATMQLVRLRIIISKHSIAYVEVSPLLSMNLCWEADACVLSLSLCGV